ncbi:MAG: hypothetical protein ACK6EB_17550, partial [Planctomyces sp.]
LKWRTGAGTAIRRLQDSADATSTEPDCQRSNGNVAASQKFQRDFCAIRDWRGEISAKAAYCDRRERLQERSKLCL